jgi:energy-coupling factor transport system ATP-binding protein
MFNVQELKIFRTGKESILENLCLTSNNRECISILGYNGSGKSTLAFSLIGLIPFQYLGKVTGNFTINDADIFNLTFSNRLKYISYVFQDTESQILFGTVSDVLGLNELDTDKESIYDLIDILEIRNDLLNKKPNELSSGESQKLALISATRSNPQLIIYDEATSALDPKVKTNFKKVIDYLLNKQKNVILLGQNVDLLKNYSDKTFYLYNKNLHSTANFAKDSTSKNFESLVTYSKIENIIDEIHFNRIFHSYNNWNCSLSVNNLTIKQGETIAIVGENGSGKSTFINAIVGFIKAKKMELNIPLNKLRDNLYIAFTSPSIQICEATINNELTRMNGEILKEIDTIQQFFSFLKLDKDPFELSFGQQRILTFLQAIFSNKQILIFDEPELGIDDNNLLLVKDLFSYNLKHKNRMIVFVTHNLELAKNYSSRVIKFHNGKIEHDELNNGLSLNNWFGV